MSSAPKAEQEFFVNGEDVWPRSLEERYGIFRVKDGGRPELVATCRTQGSLGVALVRLGLKGEFVDYTVGLMDGRDHKDAEGKWIGKWILLPWMSKPKKEDT